MAEPIDLTLERLGRLERKLDEQLETMNRRFDAVDGRLDSMESALGKIVTVLEAHDQRLEMIIGRLDRLVDQVSRARTQDLDTMAKISKRLEALEERQ